MKKTYFAPEIKVVMIQTVGMLAQSPMELNSETVSGNSALSRRGSWDDDEDGE